MPLYVTPISGIVFTQSTVNDPGFGTTTSPARVVTALNTSGSTVTIGTITTSNPVFGIVSDTCSGATLQPSPNAGDSCTLGVNFTASSVGPFSGTLTIPSTASNSPNTMTLSGSGIAGLINQSANVGFANTIVGTTSATKTVTMSNPNPSPDRITISGVTLVNTCGIAIVSDGCTGTTLGPVGSTGPVPPPATCAITVNFAPTAAGTCSETMQVTSAGRNSPSSIGLSGKGTLSSPNFAPNPLAFGKVAVGSTAGPMTETFSNPNVVGLPFVSASITGPYAIASDTCSGNTIAASGTCTIGVTFSPTVTGAAAGKLTVTTGAATPTSNVSLTGSGFIAGEKIIAIRYWQL